MHENRRIKVERTSNVQLRCVPSEGDERESPEAA
jgi:hypothetical protein